MSLKFKDLEVYKECRVLRIAVSQTVKTYFPKSERFLLTQQIIDSSRSITANIAEGHGRFYHQDNIRFCRVSRGSLEETLEHLITAGDENYIDKATLKELHKQYEICMKILNGYIRYLKNAKHGDVPSTNNK